MKLFPIRNKINQFIEVRKYIKERNYLNKYVNIHDLSINDDAYKQMHTARKGLADHLLADKCMAVDIYDAQNTVGAAAKSDSAVNLKDKIRVEVTDLLFGKTTSRILNADTKETTIHSVPDYFVVEHVEDGLQQTRLTSHDYEENFLRNLYRNISEMVNSLRPEK